MKMRPRPQRGHRFLKPRRSVPTIEGAVSRITRYSMGLSSRAAVGMLMSQPNHRVLNARAGAVEAIAFAPDGLQIAAAHVDGSLRIWDPSNGALRGMIYGHTGVVRCVRYSADGSRIASGAADHTVRLHRADTGELIGVLSGHVGPVVTLAFTPDAGRLVTGSLDQSIRVWDMRTGKETGMQVRGSRAVVSSDGARLASISASEIRLWDLAKHSDLGVISGGHAGTIHGIAFSPAGRIACACDDHKMRLYDEATRTEMAVFEGHTAAVTDVAFAPDGATVASAAADHTLR